MNILYDPGNYAEAQQTVFLFTGKISKTPFYLLIATQTEGNASIKNINVKTLPRPYTIKTHQRVHSKMFHLGMPAEQTNSVKLGI